MEGTNERSDATQALALRALRGMELLFHAAVALALGLGGAILFVQVLIDFFRGLGSDMLRAILRLLDGVLLVFIITELIHTIRAVIRQSAVVTEPFLVIGIVAGIRRLIVVTAEAKEMIGTPQFRDLIWEVAITTGSVLALGTTIFLLRKARYPGSTSSAGEA